MEEIYMEDLIQCILKVEDVGNATDLLGLEEDNTDFVSQYDVDVEYQDVDEDENVYFMLAYHTKENPDTYFDSDGEVLKFDNV